MKVGIVGSRRRTDYWDFYLIINTLGGLIDRHGLYWPVEFDKNHIDICKDPDCLHLFSGGCRQGADKFMEIIAEKRNIPKKTHHPEELVYGLPNAYFERNTLIARDSDILIACVADDRTGGTEDTIKKFKQYHPDGELIIV